MCSRLAERFTLSDFAYAHRGLWRDGGWTENSLEACLAAAEAGLGIEFDVRPASDGVPIVFHDPVLGRMTSQAGNIEERSSETLIGAALNGGGEIISFAQLLDAWPRSTPLLCELKIDGNTDPSAFAATVGGMLLDHSGPAAAMSFSPLAVAALPAELMRGQLIVPSRMSGAEDLTKIAPPGIDYYACHIDDADHSSLQQARPDLPLIAWTVKDEETCARLVPLTDSQIFEAFDPAVAKRHIQPT